MSQYGWQINIDNCIACRGCEAACKLEFQLPVGVRRRLVVIQEGTAASGKPYRQHVSTACMHCATPACVAACPVQRYWKDTSANGALRTAFGMSGNPETGLVLVKPSTAEDPVNGVDCVGCKRCFAACPYGAARWDEQHARMDKCTGCYHRLFNANLPPERQKPACVVTCPSFALRLGELTQLSGTTTTWAGTPPAGAKEIADPAMTGASARFVPLVLR